nr:hypothetical protein 51 [bacterium]
MKKTSFATTEYAEPLSEELGIAHPPIEPIEESLADDVPEFDEPLVVEFVEEVPAPESLDIGELMPEPDAEPLVITVEDSDGGESEDFEALLHEVVGYEEEEEEGEEKGEGGEKKESKDDDGLYLPGADVAYVDEPEPEPEPQMSNWVDDRDVTCFMEYLQGAYPGNIPRHDGRSISGCERAYAYLNRLNSEVSEAVRKDVSHVLDMDYIEKARVNMMRDMSTLKEHMGKLKKKLKTSTSGDKTEQALISMGKEAREEIEKEATVARQQVVLTPFERAISGILINSVVSGGHPFEDVYDFLKNKYKLDDREELAILQVVMDSGFPIFKDRGTIGKTPEKGKETEDHGIDFIKNYFG